MIFKCRGSLTKEAQQCLRMMRMLRKEVAGKLLFFDSQICCESSGTGARPQGVADKRNVLARVATVRLGDS